MKRWITAVLMVFSFAAMQAQDSLYLLQRLKDYGFQNLRIQALADTAWRVDLENGRYRFTPYGFDRFLEGMDGMDVPLHFIFREKDIPAAHLTVEGGVVIGVDWQDSWLDQPVGRAIRGTRNFGQVNFPIGLGLRYIIGHFANHELIGLDLLPGIQVTLARGLSLNGSMAVPLVNDIDRKTRVRLNDLMLVQDIRLPERLFVSFAGGFFHRNRVGVHMKWRKYFDGARWAIGMDASYTGFSPLTGPISIFENERQGLASYTFRADYLWTKYNVLFELHAGQFYRKESGVAGRAFRQFGEVRVGAELRWTNLGKDGGFFLRIPLFPKKYARPAAVRITGSPYIDINYSYERFGSIDRFYQFAPTLVDGLWEYWPSTFRGRH